MQKFILLFQQKEHLYYYIDYSFKELTNYYNSDIFKLNIESKTIKKDSNNYSIYLKQLYNKLGTIYCIENTKKKKY